MPDTTPLWTSADIEAATGGRLSGAPFEAHGLTYNSREIVPGASHFAALSIAQPSWRNAYQVATIGDHTVLKVQKLTPRKG